ncbi:hypothetical protein IZU99_06935 [Oscillospiraceae bacterium CM]|nr:hypothetical protein IZU99_06935 [Oscillospiraceae bacterium CM]
MDILKKRPVAWLVVLVVIVFGTLYGVHRSVSAASQKIEATFYNGVYLENEKYTQPSIQSQLDKRSEAALGLVTLGSRFGALEAETGALRAARQNLLSAQTISQKYTANTQLQSAYQVLYAALAAQDLGDRTEAASYYASVLGGAQAVIQNSAYNGAVAAYRNMTLAAFPVVLLKNLAFVSYPDYFGLEG